jgi:hypothetical protein
MNKAERNSSLVAWSADSNHHSAYAFLALRRTPSSRDNSLATCGRAHPRKRRTPPTCRRRSFTMKQASVSSMVHGGGKRRADKVPLSNVYRGVARRLDAKSRSGTPMLNQPSFFEAANIEHIEITGLPLRTSLPRARMRTQSCPIS